MSVASASRSLAFVSYCVRCVHDRRRVQSAPHPAANLPILSGPSFEHTTQVLQHRQGVGLEIPCCNQQRNSVDHLRMRTRCSGGRATLGISLRRIPRPCLMFSTFLPIRSTVASSFGLPCRLSLFRLRLRFLCSLGPPCVFFCLRRRYSLWRWISWRPVQSLYGASSRVQPYAVSPDSSVFASTMRLTLSYKINCAVLAQRLPSRSRR